MSETVSPDHGKSSNTEEQESAVEGKTQGNMDKGGGMREQQ